jgi:ribosomal protein S18 acetylase RimI-like enzyme
MAVIYSHKNLFSFFKLFGELSDQPIVETKFLDFIKIQGTAWPNQSFHLKANSANLEKALGWIENQVEIGAIPRLFMANPGIDQQEIIEFIKGRGYKTGHWQAMSYNLAQPLKKLPSNKLEIRTVKTAQELGQWLAIAESELMGGGKLSKPVFEKLMTENLAQLFLGYTNNKAVATGLLYCSKETAGIYLIATKAEYRGKGYGSQMTMHCLQKAKEFGLKRACLQATQSGESVYRKIGFKNDGEINLIYFDRAQTV